MLVPSIAVLLTHQPRALQKVGPLLRDSEVQAVLGSNVLPVFRLLHAQVAAAAAVLSQNIRNATRHTPVCFPSPHLPPSCPTPQLKLPVQMTFLSMSLC